MIATPKTTLKATFALSFAITALTACTSTPTKKPRATVTPPTVVKAPDFANLPAHSCRGSEIIRTPAKLSLNKQGKVTHVSGLTVKDAQLSRAITQEFKRAKYTPYKVNGQPVARHLDVAIGLKCPTVKAAKRR